MQNHGFSPPRFQAAAERNAYIIFQVIEPFRFYFRKAGRGNEKSGEVKRFQSCLFFNQKALLRRARKEICSKPNLPQDGVKLLPLAPTAEQQMKVCSWEGKSPRPLRRFPVHTSHCYFIYCSWPAFIACFMY